jgi:hypothetical protein
MALERMPVERLDLQAKLLRTVIKFSTRAPDRLVVSILYADEAKEIAQDFVKELEHLDYNDFPIQVMLNTPDALEAIDPTVNILYVTPGNTSVLEAISTFASQRNIFSFTGIPEYVEAQKVALGFGEYKGKPQIVLCLPAAQQTGHEFKNPKFLNLQTTRKLRLIK